METVDTVQAARNQSPRIRPATSTDIPAIMILEREAATAAHWPTQHYEQILSSAAPRRGAFVIESGAAVRGFLVWREAGGEWELENVVVAAPFRRTGLGTTLLQELVKLAQTAGAESVLLEVRESNQAARFMYEKSGFAESGRRPAYYRDPHEDAITYRLSFV